jgi:hypothetical protein
MGLAVGMDVSSIVLGEQASYFLQFRHAVEPFLVPLPNELWVLSDVVEWCAEEIVKDNKVVPWYARDGVFGSVYLIQNRCFRQYVKIGCTLRETPYERVSNQSWGVPERHEVVTYIKTRNPKEVEAQFHKYFKSARCIRGDHTSEFFNLNAGIAKRHFEDVALGNKVDEFSYEDMCILEKVESSLKPENLGEMDAQHDEILAREINWISDHKTMDAEPWQNAGYVYALINPLFLDLIKIGYSKDLKQRINKLSGNVPKRFRLVNCIRTLEPYQLEISIHSHFARFRHKTAGGGSTEFFRLSVEQVDAHFKTFKHGALYDGQP